MTDRPVTCVVLRNPSETIWIADDEELTGFSMESPTWLTMGGPHGRIVSVPVGRVVSVSTVNAPEKPHEH